MTRTAHIKRDTAETQIELELRVDGTGTADIQTGVGFLDHMLTLFAKHSVFDLKVRAQGDLNVDAHHTVEDTGICLGLALKEALGDKQGIRRYGHFTLPMDETLVTVAVDFSGRFALVYQASADVLPWSIRRQRRRRRLAVSIRNYWKIFGKPWPATRCAIYMS